jgi:hypothetical protein
LKALSWRWALTALSEVVKSEGEIPVLTLLF